jgi:cytochrome c biogenesis protein CcdA
LLEKLGGIALAAFGILMLGIVKIPWLYGEARIDMASVSMPETVLRSAGSPLKI